MESHVTTMNYEKRKVFRQILDTAEGLMARSADDWQTLKGRQTKLGNTNRRNASKSAPGEGHYRWHKLATPQSYGWNPR